MPATATTGGATPCKMRAGTRLSMAKRTALLIEAWAGHYPETLTNMATVIPKLVAVSQAESAGYTRACNTNTNGTRDWGWGQINGINGGSAASYDPAVCAGQILAVYHRQGYKAWSTYGGPIYLASLPAAKLAWGKQDSQIVVAGEAGIAAAEAAKGSHACVYGWTLPSLGPIGGEFVCFDTILGGLKMAAGAFGAGIAGLALLVVIARNVPGAGEAQGATRRVTSRLPSPAPVKAYRTVSGDRGRREEVRARVRRSDEQARTRTTLATAAEQRRQNESAARVERLKRPAPAARTQTVYVTDRDPMADAYREKTRNRVAAHQASQRAEAVRRHSDPDGPPF